MTYTAQHPRLSWMSRNLRILMTSPPRFAECVAWNICLGSAIMFWMTDDLFTVSRQFEYLDDIAHAHNIWASVFAMLTFVHGLAATVWRGDYRVRRWITACHVVWSMTVASFCWFITPSISPADVLYYIYVFTSAAGFLQLQFGTQPSIPD